jgi:hypothetical protein
MILRLRPRQKVKQKQQYQRPKECEANVCQGTRGPDGAREKQPESVLKKLGQSLPRNRWNDVSHSANNNGCAHENNGAEDTITYFLKYSFPMAHRAAGQLRLGRSRCESGMSNNFLWNSWDGGERVFL